MYLTEIFVVALGLIVGSFLNVVVCRHGTGRSVGGRSGCLSCGKKLGALELVPLFSWLALRGRCRGCGARVSAQYPLVELAGALVFLLAYRAHPFALAASPLGEFFLFALAAAALAALVAIVAYDFRHKIIPDSFALFLAAAALARTVALAALYGAPLSAWGFALLAGPAMALPLFLLWAVSRGRWMGLGDPKLALGLGWLIGLSGGVLALFLAFLVGAALGGAAVVWGRLRRRGGLALSSEVPFAPYLALGTVIAFATGWGAPEIILAANWLSAPVVEPILYKIYGL